MLPETEEIIRQGNEAFLLGEPTCPYSEVTEPEKALLWNHGYLEALAESCRYKMEDEW